MPKIQRMIAATQKRDVGAKCLRIRTTFSHRYNGVSKFCYIALSPLMWLVSLITLAVCQVSGDFTFQQNSASAYMAYCFCSAMILFISNFLMSVFENQSTFDKDMDESLVSCFYEPRCTVNRFYTANWSRPHTSIEQILSSAVNCQYNLSITSLFLTLLKHLSLSTGDPTAYLRTAYISLYNISWITEVITFWEWRNLTARATLRVNIMMSSSISRVIVELLDNQSFSVTSHNSNTITGPKSTHIVCVLFRQKW